MDINVMGVWMNDTVLYLARMLETSGGSVLIRDYTRNKELAHCVPSVKGIDPAETILDYAGIGYTYSGSSSERYDTCIRLYDYDRLPDSEDCFTLVIADESKIVCDTLTDMDWSDFTDAGTKLALMVKYYSGAVRKQFDDFLKKTAIKDSVFAIPMNAHDYKCAVLAEYNDNFIFTNISAKYQEALIDITRLIRSDLDLSLKEAENIFKKASKGGKR